MLNCNIIYFLIILNNYLATFISFSIENDIVYKQYVNNTNRYSLVNSILSKSIGVYKNKSKSIEFKLEKTILLTVVSYNSINNYHYKLYLLNFICFARFYDYDLIVYYMINNENNETEFYTSNQVTSISYPNDLFWSLIKTKYTNILTGKNHADYNDNQPSFNHFGSLPMLVPILEILYHGYNAIYLDIDQGLIQDPIPYIIKGDADFVTSLEIRECLEDYPSLNKWNANWHIEPNTGVLMIRSTKQGFDFFRNWLDIIVQKNIRNDQTVLNYYYKNATMVGNCNFDNENLTSIRSTSDSPNYCFLSELLFQNGKTGVLCPNKRLFRDDWIVGMINGATSDIIEDKRFPVSLHVNYVNGKSHELKVRGLWLIEELTPIDDSNNNYIIHLLSYNESVNKNTNTNSTIYFRCNQYNISDTYYAKLDWLLEYNQILDKRQVIYESAIKNGSLVRRFSGHEVYLIDENKTRHVIPDKETFEGLNYNWINVIVIPTPVMNLIPVGNEIHSLKKS